MVLTERDDFSEKGLALKGLTKFDFDFF